MKKAKDSRSTLLACLALAGIVLVIAIQHHDQPRRAAPETAETVAAIPSPVSDCIARGVRYFQEIGSYPRLSSGEDADVVAAERCNRTTTAFP
jgi:hypothetical protein